VATTVLDTSKVIEHAFRRCKVHPSKQTPETIDIAKENLYLLLVNLANRGLNLWCVEQAYVGLAAGQATYSCPAGTIDLLNLIYSQPTQAVGTDTSDATSYTTTFDDQTTIRRIGVKLSAVAASDTLTLSSSTDGIAFTTIQTETKTDWVTDEWYWFNLDPEVEGLAFKAEFTGATTFSEFYLASSIYDLPVSQWNRDTFATINNKSMSGTPSTTYYFEKLITPQVTLWPVPTTDYNHLTMFIHRQVQDVGSLTQTLEIPARWFEAIIWQLALRLAFELPDVAPDMISAVSMMADKYTLEVEDEESDGAPLYLAPNIGVYTR